MKLWFFLALALSACAIPTRQTEALLGAPPPEAPSFHRISGVEFIRQTDNYCGPATLAMALQYAGNPSPVEAVASQVYTPGKQGTLQTDMLGSARRHGMLAVQIYGLTALLKEISANHPVIVFMNLGLSWYPIYHYAIVTGYNLSEPSVFMHSGKTKDKEWDMRKFERSWEPGKYWGLVVLPPSAMAVTADEAEHAAAGAGLEAVGRITEAEMVYRNILKRWPTSFGALLGMGNLAFEKKDFAGSVAFLQRAVKDHPQNSAAWHNLATAQGALGKKSAARFSAIRAMALVPPEAAPAYQASLREWLAPLPKKQEL